MNIQPAIFETSQLLSHGLTEADLDPFSIERLLESSTDIFEGNILLENYMRRYFYAG